MPKFRRIIALGLFVLLLFFLTSGGFLVRNDVQRADVIVVLAGETDRRPARGLELLGQGYGQRLILDVPAGATIYQWKQTELAEIWAHGLRQANAVTVCSIRGLSTKAEARDVAGCLEHVPARKVLLVTSDYHTRRAVSVFRKEVPGYEYSVAAAYDAEQFGSRWWERRQWAKVNFDEWLRLMWWQLVDRWH